MIQDTLQKIEAQLKNAPAVKDENRVELLALVSTLKQEVAELSKTDADQAQSIAGFAQVSAHEATRGKRDPEMLKLSLAGLSGSVSGFEKSHPRLVEIVNSISVMLSNIGI